MNRPHRGRRFALATLAAVLTGALLVAGCGSSDSSSKDGASSTAKAEVTPPAAIKSAGTIKYCIDWSNPPMEFNSGGTTPKGSDPDTGAALAALMGVKAEWRYLGFDGLIAALQSKKCDAILSGMNDTADRQKTVDFVDYVSVGDVVMVRQEDAGTHIDSLTDLSGKKMATQTGTTEFDQIDAANKQLKAEGKPPISLTYMSKSSDAIAGLQAGKLDADFNQAPAQAYAISKAPPGTFAIVSDGIGAAPIGIATRKDDTELHDALQQAVEKLYANGGMCKILSTWHMESLALPDKPACS